MFIVSHFPFLIPFCCLVQLFTLLVYWKYACEGLQWHLTPHIVHSSFISFALSAAFSVIDHFSSKTFSSLCNWHTSSGLLTVDWPPLCLLCQISSPYIKCSQPLVLGPFLLPIHYSCIVCTGMIENLVTLLQVS